MSGNGYSKPWRRSRKIDLSGRQFRVNTILSEDELDMIRSYGEGFSLLELSGAYQCDKTTILRTIRELSKKLAGSAKPIPIQENANARNIPKL
jgi:hypothetical protein